MKKQDFAFAFALFSTVSLELEIYRVLEEEVVRGFMATRSVVIRESLDTTSLPDNLYGSISI